MMNRQISLKEAVIQKIAENNPCTTKKNVLSLISCRINIENAIIPKNSHPLVRIRIRKEAIEESI